MKPALKNALKIVLGALAIVLVVGGTAAYLGMQLRRDPNELSLGSPIPQIDLVDSEGRPFTLTSVGKQRLPVLVFYRGHW